MEFGYQLVLLLHFIGMASLVGGILIQISNRGAFEMNALIRHGVGTQIVTGIILTGMAEGLDELDKDIPVEKLGLKLVVAIVIAFLAERNRKRKPVGDTVFYVVAGLALVNVAVAALWT